jgi:hypothetical protein
MKENMKAIKNVVTMIIFLIMAIIGFLFIFSGKILLGIIIIVLIVGGIIIKKYLEKKKTKLLSNSWTDINVFFLILIVIIMTLVRYFVFNKKIYLIEIIVGVIFLMLIYICFRFLVPKLMKI